MEQLSVICPDCKLGLRLPPTVRAGSVVRCRECKCIFLAEPEPCDVEVVEAEMEEVIEEVIRVPEPEAPPAPRPPQTSGFRRPRRKEPANVWPFVAGLSALAVVFIAVGLGLVVWGLGQRDAKPNSTPQNSAQAAAPVQHQPVEVGLPTGWEEVSIREGGFRVAMQGPVSPTTSTFETWLGPITSPGYTHDVAGERISFIANYMDFTEAHLKEYSVDQLMEVLLQNARKQYNATQIRNAPIEQNGLRGREVEMWSDSKGRSVARYYSRGTRVVFMSIFGFGVTADSREVRAFFDSFRLLDD